MPSDNESTFSDGPLDIRLMSNDQVLDYFLNETFEHPACGLGGDLAHFLWGSKPAIFDDDEPPCLSRLFKQEGDRNINPNFLSIKVYPAKSPRLDAEGNETWDAHCTLIINRTNFAQLVKNDPEYFRPIFGDETNPARMLSRLKSDEPLVWIRMPELMGMLLGFGKHNAKMFTKCRESLRWKGYPATAEEFAEMQHTESTIQHLPWWSGYNGIYTRDDSFKLVKPPYYYNWPSPESERLTRHYTEINRGIAKYLLNKTGFKSMPERSDRKRYELGRAVTTLALKEVFTANSWVVQSLASQSQQRSGSGVKFSFRSLFGQQQHPRTLRHVTGHIGATPTFAHGSSLGIAGAPSPSTRTRPAAQEQPNSSTNEPSTLAREALGRLTMDISSTPPRRATSTGHRRKR